MHHTSNQTLARKFVSFGAACIVLASFAAPQLQAQDSSKPGPEQKDYGDWVGDWKYEVQTKSTPMGPAEKFAGKITYSLALNGFYLEGKFSEKHGADVTKGQEWHWYDPATKTRMFNSFGSEGFFTIGTETKQGRTWTSIGTQTDGKGQTSKCKTTGSFSLDGKVFTGRWELSMDDGKTWVPWWEITMKKK